MMTKSQKWLIGCGAGCGLLVLIIVALVGGAALFVRDKVQVVREASQSRRELVNAFGAADSFIPPPDGAITRDRLELFVSVRDSLRDAQKTLDGAIASFDAGRLAEAPGQGHRSLGDVLEILNDFGNLITPIGAFVNHRNRVLLDRKMGLGEYAYIYAIAYYSWLGHSPSDGPDLLKKLGNRDRDRSSGETSTFTPDNIRRHYRRLMLRLLGNQLDEIKGVEETEWRRTVEEEIDRMDRDSERVAWQECLPPRVGQALEPFRKQLERSYHASTNCFELLTTGESTQLQLNY
jgi:hypothetical protein